jgi:FixJ family two-component response regulator
MNPQPQASGASSYSPTVLVVDDDPSVCSSLRRLLKAQGFQAQTFNSPQHLLRLSRPCGPSCLLLDVNIPQISGLDLLDALRQAGIRIPVIFITGFGDVPSSVRAMKGGAVDFLPKPLNSAVLLAAVRRALELDARMLVRERDLSELHGRYLGLTEREREVLFAVTAGMLNKQIGAEMGVTEKTIKVHRGHVMEKMRADSLPELVRMADLLKSPTEPHGTKVQFAPSPAVTTLDGSVGAASPCRLLPVQSSRRHRCDDDSEGLSTWRKTLPSSSWSTTTRPCASRSDASSAQPI